MMTKTIASSTGHHGIWGMPSHANGLPMLMCLPFRPCPDRRLALLPAPALGSIAAGLWEAPWRSARRPAPSWQRGTLDAMPRLTPSEWRDGWEPTPNNRALEVAFIHDHWKYGVSIHTETAKALIAALSAGSSMSVGHPLYLRLFAEFANSLESLGAWGWTIRNRRKFKLFMDGFLTYPMHAPGDFYRLARDCRGRDAQTLFDLLKLPDQALVVPAVAAVAEPWSEEDTRLILARTMFNLKQAAVQFFAGNQAILTGYNRAKHGVTMMRPPAMTDPRQFQIIAPHLRIEEGEPEGIHYDIQTFRVDKTMITRLQGNIESVADSIKVLALLTWGLLEAGLSPGGG
jgi:hypothetical protein